MLIVYAREWKYPDTTEAEGWEHRVVLGRANVVNVVHRINMY